VACRALCPHQHTTPRQMQGQRLKSEEAEEEMPSQTHHKMTAGKTPVDTEIVDVGSVQGTIEPDHPIEAIAVPMSGLPAMDHLAKNAAGNVNVAVVVKSVAVSEMAVVDVTVASGKEEAIDRHANQEECANHENLAKVVAADANAALAKTADGHETIGGAEVEVAQMMDARGDETLRIKGKDTETRRGDVKTSLLSPS
jgi:hypothetical protein